MVAPVRTLRVNLAAVHTDDKDEGRAELDSHADTCVVGRNALIVADFERPMRVFGYNSADGSKIFKTVTAALAYDDPISGSAWLLIIHQAVHIPELGHHLLCPMQLRINDVEVNETPKFLTNNPTDKTHAVVVRNPESTDPHHELLIPLSLHNVTSYFPTRKPTREEYNQLMETGDYYELTQQTP